MCCISVICSGPKPLSARFCISADRLAGADHNWRSFSSLSKNSGSLPKSSSINWIADMGVPSDAKSLSFPYADHALFAVCQLDSDFWANDIFIFRSPARGHAAGRLGIGAIIDLCHPFYWLRGFTIPILILKFTRLDKVIDSEEILAIIKTWVPRPIICLNSIIDLIGRMSTMLRTLQASTPVESFCDVVRMVGMVLSLS